jgi:hypothetical protein
LSVLISKIVLSAWVWLYAWWISGYNSNDKFARSSWLFDYFELFLYKKYWLLASNCLRVSPLYRTSGSNLFLLFLVASIALFSWSMVRYRYLILISCKASVASFWTWNRSVTRVAFGKHFLAINPIFPATSSVISSTRFRCLSGIFYIIAITVSAFVPATIATIVPALPLAVLLVKMV